MKLLIGLGNPGAKYAHNRHNVGHMFVDYVNKEIRGKSNEVRGVKTDCFMNVSGKFVKKFVTHNSYLVSDIYIVHDDLDIPFGSFKVQLATGPKVHNGISSVEEELGTNEFWRIRVGVDGRPAVAGRPSGEDYVLSDFTPEEKNTLTEVFSRIYSKISNALS